MRKRTTIREILSGACGNFSSSRRTNPTESRDCLLSRGRFQPLVARYDQVATVAPGTIRLNCSERALELYQPNEAWLAVRKDLLDQQIIDTKGRKVVRVNDVDLTEQRKNGNVELRLTQVDVGLPGAVRRLLQGVVSPRWCASCRAGCRSERFVGNS